MDFSVFIERAKEIRKINAKLTENEGNKAWGTAERMVGFVGDVGDLAKLVMAKQGFRTYENLDKRIGHELADCLWSIIILSDELGVDLEKAFWGTMEELEHRL